MLTFSRKNRRKASLKNVIFRIIKVLLSISVIVLLFWYIIVSNPTKFLNVSIQWDLDPDLPISKKQLVEIIQPHISDKYKLDLHQIKDTIEQEPWIENASIKRLFWNFIKIKIDSRKVAMIWQDAECGTEMVIKEECIGYISTKGELFIPDSIPKQSSVQAISNSDYDSISELYKYYHSYEALIHPLKIKTFIKTNIDKIIIEPNVKVILGYKNQHNRLVRFKKVYDKLRKRSKKVERAIFDMRYPKGFSLSY